jgi:two-component system, sensor histidine kinase YesM
MRLEGIAHALASALGSVKDRWMHARLLQKLIIACLLCMVLPVLATGTILFSIVLPLAQTESREAMNGVVAQLNENVRYRVNGYQNILAQLSLDPRFGAIMTERYPSLEEAVGALVQVNQLLGRINSYFPMRRVYVYKANQTLPEDGGSILDIARARAEPWYEGWQETGARRFLWFYRMSESQQPCLNVCASLRDPWGDEQYGVVRLEIPCPQFFDGLANPLADKKGRFVLLDAERRFLAPPAGARPSDLDARAPWVDAAYRQAAGWAATRVAGTESLVVWTTTDLGWKLIAVASQEVLWTKVRLIQDVALIVCALFVILTALFLLGFGSNMTRRLNRLVASMRAVRDGKLGLQVDVHGTDEIASAEGEFNAMSRQLEQTLRELAAARALAEEEELRLLQAQINPHFLYNTLSFVKFMAMDIDARAIADVVDTIARFFRLSLNRGRTTLPLRDEMEHVRAYLEIHELRFPRKVAVTYAVDPAVLDAEVLSMTLQPIVENALVHAFADRAGRGALAITAAREGADLVLRVSDDGRGMSADRVRGALERPAAERRGYGVYNVHERLRRRFGRASGVSIESAPGAGTRVTVRMPFRAAGGGP